MSGAASAALPSRLTTGVIAGTIPSGEGTMDQALLTGMLVGRQPKTNPAVYRVAHWQGVRLAPA